MVEEEPFEGGSDRQEAACPDCAEPLPAGAPLCPHCGTVLSEGGDAVGPADLDGPSDGEESPAFPQVGERRGRASGRVRVVAGLAVAVPLAPLALFLAGTVRPLTVWSGALVFLGGWLAPAAYLSRARVPAEAFAHSLYLVAAATALIPVGLRVGDEGVATGDLSVGYGAVTAAVLVVAGAAALLGRYVDGQVNRRMAGESRAFEGER